MTDYTAITMPGVNTPAIRDLATPTLANYYPARHLHAGNPLTFHAWEERPDTQPEGRREYRFACFASGPLNATPLRLWCTKAEAAVAFAHLLAFYEIGNLQGNDLCLVGWDPETGYIIDAFA